MCRPADKTIYVFGRLYVKMNVNPVYYLLSKDAFYHLFLYFAATVSTSWILYSCWVPRDIGIFTTANKYYLFEVAEMTSFTEFEKKTLFDFLSIFHW